jgi:hypothetical protein
MFKNTYSAQKRRIFAFAKVWTKAYLAACARGPWLRAGRGRHERRLAEEG